MTRRESVERALFALVLLGTIVAQVASAAHLAEAFEYANDGFMPLLLATIVVVMEMIFIALAVITPPGRSRDAVLFGMGLVQVVAWAGNFAMGGLRVEERMPVSVAALFFLPKWLADRLAAFFLAGMLPLLVLISVYAIAKTANKLLAEPPTNPDAARLLEVFEKEFSATTSNGEAAKTNPDRG